MGLGFVVAFCLLLCYIVWLGPVALTRQVILAGGTARFPPVKTAMQRVFDAAVIEDSMPADEACVCRNG